MELALVSLISCLFFLFIVPYINLTNDYFTKKSKDKREDNLHEDKILKIQRETEEEEEKAKREIAIEIVREQKGRNQQVDELKKSIEILEQDLSSERSKSLELLDLHSQESQKFSDQIKNLIESNKKLEIKSLNEIQNNYGIIDQKNEEIHVLQRDYNNYKMQLENEKKLNIKLGQDQEKLLKNQEILAIQNSNFKEKNDNLINDLIEKDFIISRMKYPGTKVLKIGNKNILEYFNVVGQIKYYDFENKIIMSYSDIISLLTMGNEIIDNTNNVILNRALTSFEEYNTSK